MINLFKIKGQKQNEATNASGRPPAKKQSPGELRLHKDLSELNLPQTTKMSFPNGKDDLMNFEVSLRPDEGYYVGGTFIFAFQVPPSYPHEPPKVKCKTKVYHPNIDLEGNVCLNILREDWKPVLNINTIIYGLNLLFTQPNDEDPLNQDAAAVLRDNPRLFETNVRRAMNGDMWVRYTSLGAFDRAVHRHGVVCAVMVDMPGHIPFARTKYFQAWSHGSGSLTATSILRSIQSF